jgi:transposase
VWEKAVFIELKINGKLRKASSGHPKASNEQQDEELLNFLRERPMSNAVEAIHQTNFSASRSTACRRIRSSELGNYWAVKKPFLTNLHKEQSRICS